MKKLVFSVCVAVAACVSFGDTNVTVVVVDKEAAQKRMEEAKARYDAMTEAQRRARVAEIEAKRQEFLKKNETNPKRIVSRVKNADGTITITRADGTTQTFKYVEKK